MLNLLIFLPILQGRKFKDKAHSQQPSITTVPDSDLHLSDPEQGQTGKPDQYPITFLKRPNDGAGDGFVTSIRGLFNTQRRKAKAFVLRTMRGEEDDFQGEWSESDTEFSPFARQLTITKAKRLIRRHTKKFRNRGQKGLLIFPSYIMICDCNVGIFSFLLPQFVNPAFRLINLPQSGSPSKQGESPSSPRETTPFEIESDSSSGSSPSPFEDFHELGT